MFIIENTRKIAYTMGLGTPGPPDHMGYQTLGIGGMDCPGVCTCSPCWSTVLAAVAAMLCQRCCRNAAVVVAMLLLCWCCNVVATEPEGQWHNQAQAPDTGTSTSTDINTDTRTKTPSRVIMETNLSPSLGILTPLAALKNSPDSDP